jgi:hypothetical protein
MLTLSGGGLCLQQWIKLTGYQLSGVEVLLFSMSGLIMKPCYFTQPLRFRAKSRVDTHAK